MFGDAIISVLVAIWLTGLIKFCYTDNIRAALIYVGISAAMVLGKLLMNDRGRWQP